MKRLPARLHLWRRDILGNEGNPSPHLGTKLEQGFPLGKLNLSCGSLSNQGQTSFVKERK